MYYGIGNRALLSHNSERGMVGTAGPFINYMQRLRRMETCICLLLQDALTLQGSLTLQAAYLGRGSPSFLPV
jgi:hypothetical protein